MCCAGTARGRRGRHPFQRRFWRDLPEAAGKIESTPRGRDLQVSRPPVTLLTLCSVLLMVLIAAVHAAAGTPVTCASPASVQGASTEYFVSLIDAPQHLAHVSIRLREGNGVRTLEMPVWNALYQIRNFAANIEDVRAQDATGTPAKVFKSKTSEWQITAADGCVVVSYDIHLDSPGPFGSTLTADRGFLNWAMVLMYSPSLRSEPVSIRLFDVPTPWQMRDLHVL